MDRSEPDAPVVLVVDDEPLVARLTQRCLEEVGCRVLTAGDGVTALDLLSLHAVYLLVADVRMPGMSGDELARQALLRGRASRVLFVTAHDDHPETLRRLGPVLTKPYDPEALCRIAARLIAGASDPMARPH
jgi:CheY-like chemotaxis protein